jgi:hypothetical protein
MAFWMTGSPIVRTKREHEATPVAGLFAEHTRSHIVEMRQNSSVQHSTMFQKNRHRSELSIYYEQSTA